MFCEKYAKCSKVYLISCLLWILSKVNMLLEEFIKLWQLINHIILEVDKNILMHNA